MNLVIIFIDLILFAGCLLSSPLFTPITTDLTNPPIYSATPYIVGGHQAQPFDHPFVVYITDGATRCGGAIISKNLVLTAGHCIGDKPIDQYKVLFHKFDISKDLSSENSVEFKVKKIVIHPNFIKETYDNDIAILVLDNDKLEPISGLNLDQLAVLDTEGIQDDTSVKIAGWGLTSWKGAAPNLPKEIDMKIVNGQQCEALYKKFDPNTQLCTSWITPQDSACAGDSGGPIFVGNKIVGLVSHGAKKCDIQYSVDTKIHGYIGWIQQIQRENSGVDPVPISIQAVAQAENPSSPPNSGEENKTNGKLWGQFVEEMVEYAKSLDDETLKESLDKNFL